MYSTVEQWERHRCPSLDGTLKQQSVWFQRLDSYKRLLIYFVVFDILISNWGELRQAKKLYNALLDLQFS